MVKAENMLKDESIQKKIVCGLSYEMPIQTRAQSTQKRKGGRGSCQMEKDRAPTLVMGVLALHTAGYTPRAERRLQQDIPGWDGFRSVLL